MARNNWALQALCSETDPESHFFGKGVPPKAARATCSHCEVKAICLQDALTRDDFGVWGGYTRAERAAMRLAS